MSVKMIRMAGMAANESQKSELEFKHGAIIFQGRKKICAGFNHNNRTTYRGNICCSLHAEMDTVVRFLNSYIKIHINRRQPDKIRRKMGKYSLCVVRITEQPDGQQIYMNSLPCMDCVKKLKQLGIDKVIYSNQYFEIVSARISRIEEELSGLVKLTNAMKKTNVIENMRIVPLIYL